MPCSQGLDTLHKYNFVHGSMTIENCLVDSRWTVKLTDYAIVDTFIEVGPDGIHCSENNPFRNFVVVKSSGRNSPYKVCLSQIFSKDRPNGIPFTCDNTKFNCTELLQLPPERLRTLGNFGPSVRAAASGDMYGFGMILYQVLFRTRPFENVGVTTVEGALERG
jgi:serine/threonine protein kinase